MTGTPLSCARSRRRLMLLAGRSARRAIDAPPGKSNRFMTSTSRRAVRAFWKTDCAIRPASAIVMPDVRDWNLVEEFESELQLPGRVRRCRDPAGRGGIDD